MLRHVRLVGSSLLAICGIVMGGCSNAADTTAAAPPPAAGVGPTETAATTAGAPASTSAIGSGDYRVSGIEVVLLDVKRTSGDTITVRWEYHNTTQAPAHLINSTGSWTDPYKLAFESYLIDNVNRKKLLVLKDAGGDLICGTHPGGLDLQPGGTLRTWAKYPAPPPGVQKVSVFIDGAPPFDDAPVSR